MNPLSDADPAGATPLSDEDIEGLIPTYVATRADLNVVEQANIEAATRWAFRSRKIVPTRELLTVSFSNRVHRRMFGEVWTWAGTQRIRETNIGVDPVQIPEAIRVLLDDVRCWNENGTHAPVERAVRLHHRLVSVHPFRNGNGRHARFMADLYLRSIGLPRLTWGGHRLDTDGDGRAVYLEALRRADDHDVESLVAFAST